MINFDNYSEGGNPFPAGIHKVEVVSCQSGTSSKKFTPFISFTFCCVEDNNFGAGVGQTIEGTYYWTDATLGTKGAINPGHAALHILNKFMPEAEARELIQQNGTTEVALAAAINKALADRREKDEKANIGFIKIVQKRRSDNQTKTQVQVSVNMPFFQSVAETNRSAMLQFDPAQDIEKPLEAGSAVPNALPPTNGGTFTPPAGGGGFSSF
jgi:hypothetical protein